MSLRLASHVQLGGLAAPHPCCLALKDGSLGFLTPLPLSLPRCRCSLAMNVRFIAQAMQAYFDRDSVALPGVAKYFGVSHGYLKLSHRPVLLL
jgi:hypothetical protein